jgi:hypothetical protein
MIYNMNVDINDIKEIENELSIVLTDEQREAVLKGYGRVVMDRAGDWADIIKELINEMC